MDASRKPTKRQKGAIGSVPASSPRAGEKPSRARVGMPRAPKPKGTPKLRVPKPSRPLRAPGRGRDGRPAASSPTAGPSRPAFLDWVAPRANASERPASGREERQRHQRALTLKMVARVAATLAALALVAGVAFLVLRNSAVFSIDNVEVEPTEHVTSDDLQKLVQVPEGSTLLNVDTAAIEEALKTDPWVGSVTFERSFPHTLKLTINEQKPDALVVMSSGSVAWYLGSAGTWIQPTKLTPAEGQSVNDAALALALPQQTLLITDVPSTVSPEAGATATDEAIQAVQSFRKGFSADFAAQVVRYSAPSADNISCTLSSGIEVELGHPENIEQKESIVKSYLDSHEGGQLLIINVRVVSNPGVRPVGSDKVQSGQGVTAMGSAGSDGAAPAGGEKDDTAAGSSDSSASGDAGSGSDASAGTSEP